jgi:hypothetical protein
MSTILSALVTVFGIMLLGMLTERRRLFAPTMALCLNQFVYWVSLPSLLFTQMSTLTQNDTAQAFIWGTLVASMLCYLITYALFLRKYKQSVADSAILSLGSTFPNAAFLGLPFIFMVFPNNEIANMAGMLGTLLYSGIFLTADATLDIYTSCTNTATIIHGYTPQNYTALQRIRLTIRLLKELAHNPMLLASILGFAVHLSSYDVPASLLKITSMLGSTAAPCALFGMGMVLSAQLSDTAALQKIDRKYLTVISLIKLLLQPLVTCVTLYLFGCRGIMLAVGTITAAMPTATLVYVLGERYQTCTAKSSLIVIITTVLSLLSLPAIVFFLQCIQII